MTTNTKGNRVRAKFYMNKSFGNIVGKTIQEIRPCSDHTVEVMGWHDYAIEIVFTDGSTALVTSDAEENGPGWLITEEFDSWN